MKKIFTLFICLLFIVSCATNPFPLKEFKPDIHGSAAGEWSPHRKVTEWWYATGILKDNAENLYLYQFTIFHGYLRGMFEGYILQLAITDIRSKQHYFFEESSRPDAHVYGNEGGIFFKNNKIIPVISNGDITALRLEGKAPGFSFALTAHPVKPVVWHGEKGIITMGHEDQPRERSFYYSFTAMNTEGELSLNNANTQVRGSGWFDRQWGVFKETAWDWFSLRLFDGREFMLFAFPGTAYCSGTLVSQDGTASPVSGFAYERLNLMQYRENGRVYSLGWQIRIPGCEEFRIIPLLADQGNPSRYTPPYWEGICSVLSPDGRLLGYCVVETTAGAQ